MLVDQITSGSGTTWNALAESLVGKELLWWGANVIVNAEEISDAINGVQDLSRENMDKVLQFAYTNEVSCDTNKPATVKVRIYDNGSVPTVPEVVGPFQVMLQIGSLTFFNLEYQNSSEELTLYQGTLCQAYSGTEDFVRYDGATAFTDKSWRLYSQFKEGKYQSAYIKLGEGAVSSSVRVFAQQKSGAGATGSRPIFPYTEYNAALSDPEAQLYKVRTGWDRSVNVLFGDSNWAKTIDVSQYQYQILWLQGGTSRFNMLSSAQLFIAGSEYDGSAGAAGITKQNASGSLSVYYESLSTTDGESNSLSYARSYVVSALYKTRGVVTDTQIKNFVNSFDSVQSAKVTSANGVVQVVVKPTVEGDTAFGFLQDFLYQYGVDGMQYVVRAGTPLYFSVHLTAVDTTRAVDAAAAKRVVMQEFSYSSLSILSDVSAAIINQTLILNGINGVVSSIRVTEPVEVDNGQQVLSALPVVNTIKQYVGESVLVGFDSDGVYKELAPVGSETPGWSVDVSGTPYVSVAGDYLYVSNGSNYYMTRFEESRLVSVDAGLAFNMAYGVFATQSRSNMVMFRLASGGSTVSSVDVYAESAAFRDGYGSLFSRNSRVTPLMSYGIDHGTLDLTANFLYDGSYLYLVETGGSGAQVWRYELSASSGASKFVKSPISIGDAGNVQAGAMTFYGNMVFVPSGTDRKLGVYYLFDPVSGYSTQGSVTWMDDSSRELYVRSLWFSGSTLYILGTEGSDTGSVTLYQCNYRFVNSNLGLQLSVLSSVVLQTTGSEVAARILNVEDAVITVGVSQEEASPMVWRGSMSSLTSGTPYAIGDSRLFVEMGTVDYNLGVIYGLSNSNPSAQDVLVYEVSGSLMRDTTFPVLDTVTIE